MVETVLYVISRVKFYYGRIDTFPCVAIVAPFSEIMLVKQGCSHLYRAGFRRGELDFIVNIPTAYT